MDPALAPPFDVRARIALLVCVLAFLAQAVAVNRYAVDIPNYDEWMFLHPDNTRYLTASLDVDWLFQRHNEHLIPLTRLQVWLLYRLNGWDLAFQQRANLVLFGAVMAALAYALVRLSSTAPRWIGLAFLPLVASPVGYGNHLWGFQSQFHLGLLGLVLAAAALFSPLGGWRALAGGLAASVVAVLSQSIGVAGLVGLTLSYAGFKLEEATATSRSAEARAVPAELRRRALRELALGCLSLFLVIMIATWGYERPAWHPPRIWPWDGAFWSFLANEVSLGFGLTGVRPVLSLLSFACLAAVASPLLLVSRGRLRVEARVRWGLAGLTLALLAALSSIAVGRAGLGLGAAKAPRYFQVAATLVPIAAVAWWLLFETKPLLQRGALAVFGVMCLCCSYDDFHFDRYRVEQANRQAGLAKIQAYYQGAGDGRLGKLSPWPDLRLQFAEARRLNVSFTRGMKFGEPSAFNDVPARVGEAAPP